MTHGEYNILARDAKCFEESDCSWTSLVLTTSVHILGQLSYTIFSEIYPSLMTNYIYFSIRISSLWRSFIEVNYL